MTHPTLRRRLVLRAAGAAAATLALPRRWRSRPGPPSRSASSCPYPPGGSSDIIARAISQPLSEALKQSVIVENKAGANGNLGADLVAKSPPDGYTLLLCDVGALAISPSVYTKLPFDPSKDLRGVTMLAYSPHLLVVHPSVPANNLKELVALSKKTELNFAVTATGSAPHLAGVARGARQRRALAVRALQGRRAGHPGHRRRPDPGADERHARDAAARAERQAQGAGRFQGDAHAADRRRADHRRAGRAGLRVRHLAGRAGAARHARRRCAARSTRSWSRIIRSPDIRARLAGQGAEVVTMTPAEQEQFFNKERARWAKVVDRRPQIKLD